MVVTIEQTATPHRTTDQATGTTHYTFPDGKELQVFWPPFAKGNYCNVSQGKLISTHETLPVAVKRLHSHMASDENIRDLKTEAEFLRLLSTTSPHLFVKEYGFFLDKMAGYIGNACLLMELLNQFWCVLSDYNARALTLDDIVFICYQMSVALTVLEHHQILHRDIKLNNTMFHQQLNLIKVFDLGTAGPLSSLAVRTRGRMVQGTASFIAPEMWLDSDKLGPITHQVDWYAMTLSIMQLICDYVFFEGVDQHAVVQAAIHDRSDQDGLSPLDYDYLYTNVETKKSPNVDVKAFVDALNTGVRKHQKHRHDSAMKLVSLLAAATGTDLASIHTRWLQNLQAFQKQTQPSSQP